MAESNHDDLADALARLAGGDVAPSEHKPAAAPPPPPVKARPTSPRPVGPKPAAMTPRPAAPGMPAPPRPARDPPGLRSPVPRHPAHSQGGALPVIRPAPPVPRKARPELPRGGQLPAGSNPPAAADRGTSTRASAETDPNAIIDDDDMMNIPAPEASVFQPRPKPAPRAGARATNYARRSLDYRRTLIPILLVLGLYMAWLASLKYFSGPDSVLATVPVLGAGPAGRRFNCFARPGRCEHDQRQAAAGGGGEKVIWKQILLLQTPHEVLRRAGSEARKSGCSAYLRAGVCHGRVSKCSLFER